MSEFCINYLGQRGGGALYTLHLARALQDNGCNLHVVYNEASEVSSLMESEKFKKNHLKVPNKISALINPLSHAIFLMNSFCVWRKMNVKLVLITMVSPFDFLQIPIWLFFRYRIICVAHDVSKRPGISKIGLALSNLLARISEKVVVLSQNSKEEFIARSKKWAPKLIVSRHGSFEYSRQRKSRDPRVLKVLFFGRIAPYKGIDIIIDAIKIAQDKYQEITLSIYGEGDFSMYMKMCAGIKKIRVVNRWIAEREISEIFNCHDILVAPYSQASQSGVIPLALGMGVPVITTNVGGLMEQIQENSNCIVLPKGSGAGALANVLVELFEDSVKLDKMNAMLFQQADIPSEWRLIAKQLILDLGL